MSASNNNTGYNGRGGNNPGYNNRSGDNYGYNNRSYNNNYGRGGFNGNNMDWRAPSDGPSAVSDLLGPVAASQAQMGAFHHQLPLAASPPDPTAAASGSSAYAVAPFNFNDNSRVEVLPAMADTNDTPAAGQEEKVTTGSSALSTSDAVSAQNIDASAADVVIAKNETKPTKHVSDKVIEQMNEGFAMMDDTMLLRLQLLNGVDAVKLRSTLEKVHAAKNSRTAAFMKTRDTIDAAITTTFGLEQEQEKQVVFHYDRFARKFRASMDLHDGDASKSALLLEANASMQAAKQHRDAAKQHRETIEKLHKKLRDLNVKLFRTCEFSWDAVMASMKWACDRVNMTSTETEAKVKE